MPSDTTTTSAKNIVKLAELLPAHLRSPQVGIVCGSGLGTLAESITERVIVPYSVLEGFGESTGACLDTRTTTSTNTGITIVLGHRSELAFGKVGNVPVVVMLGRVRLCPLLSWWGLFSETYKSSIRTRATRSRRLCTRYVLWQIWGYKI